MGFSSVGKKGSSSPSSLLSCLHLNLAKMREYETVKQTQFMTSEDPLVARTPFIGFFY